MQPTLVRYSSIAAFKACPNRYRLAFVENLVPEREPATTRMGSNWHAMHECYADAVADANGDPLIAVYELLNQRYAEVPSWLTADEWALERQILLVSFQAYQWYFQNDPIEFLASEVVFRLPLHNPKLGLPLPTTEVQREGHIDHVIRYNGGVMVLERKSTSKSLAPDSDFWQRWTKDDQISTYALAMRDMCMSNLCGELDLSFAWKGADRVGNTLLDVWHKPSIKPAMLTQKETAEFIASGEYCGQKFTVGSAPVLARTQPSGDDVYELAVDNGFTLAEPGKKGFAIKENVEMFGARLLQEYYENPTRYFVRREIARTDAEIRDFQASLWAVYQTQAAMRRSGNWYGNYSQCRATFACPFIPICHGPGADAVSDGTTTPSGFKRQKFVDLTIKGEVPMEQE